MIPTFGQLSLSKHRVVRRFARISISGIFSQFHDMFVIYRVRNRRILEDEIKKITINK